MISQGDETNKKRDQEGKDDDADDGGGDENMIPQDEDDNKNKSKNEELNKEDEDDQDRYHWLFHLIMAFGAVYLAMLLSDWGNGTGMTREENDATAYTAMWVNAIGSWCAYFLFMWIRFAPICCPGRDFNMEREIFREMFVIMIRTS